MSEKNAPPLRTWAREMLAGGHLGFGEGWMTARELAELNRAVLSEANITEIDHPGTAAMAERIAPVANVAQHPAKQVKA